MAEENQDGAIIPYVEFVDNTNERTPCVLVLDCSGSMEGEAMEQLNDGLQAFEQELKDDIDASARVQVLVLRAFGLDEVEVAVDWTDAMDFTAPDLVAEGLTPLGEAMDMALDMIEERKRIYDENGITSKRPWVFMISDGAPTDVDWERVADRCHRAVENKHALIHAIGVEGADFDILSRFTPVAPKMLNGLKFKEFFLWLSRSVASVSQADVGAPVQLSATDDWAVVEL